MKKPEVRNSLLDYIDKQFAEIHKEWEEYHKQEMDKIKEAASVEKIFDILDKKVDEFNLQISVGQGKKISKEIHKLIGK